MNKKKNEIMLTITAYNHNNNEMQKKYINLKILNSLLKHNTLYQDEKFSPIPTGKMKEKKLHILFKGFTFFLYCVLALD